MRTWAWIAAVALLPACPACGSGSPAISANPPPATSDTPSTTSSDPTTSSSDPTATSSTSSSPTTTEALALPARIVCGAQYRPDAASLEGAEDKGLTIERDDVGANAGASLEFPTMTLTASYVGDVPEGPSVLVVVTTSDAKPLLTVLYQLGEMDLSQIGFAGDHGFTGLHYVQNRRANLQFWCAAG